MLARVFAQRWHGSAEAGTPYLRARLEMLTGLQASPALPAVLEQMQRARRDRLPVLFYGDYDVDGVISVCTLFRVSQHLGMKANYFLPSRSNEGYGLSQGVVRQAAEKDYKLIFALDCGTSNHEEVELAKELGLQVVALDHHSAAKGSPNIPLINPHLAAGIHPLCTAGMAYLFAREWLDLEGERPTLADESFLELAAIGTIADVVPLVGDNFILAHLGMKQLPQTKLPGLRALLVALKLETFSFLTWRDLAFNLIPHLNAAGRMAHAKLTAELLLTQDRKSAAHLAVQLLSLNVQRRQVQDETYRKACQHAAAQDEASVLVLYQPDWNQGVTGIVAAKIAEVFGKPTLILSDSSAENGVAVGSGRAPAAVDLLATIEPARSLFTKLGGHAAAVGGTIPIADIEDLRRIVARSEPVKLDSTDTVTFPEGEASPEELGEELIPTLLDLYPFGTGHPPPRVILRHALVKRVDTVGRDHTHLSLTIDRGTGRTPLRVIGFQKSHLQDRLREGVSCDLIVEIELDNFRNQIALQTQLIDVSAG